MLFSVDPGQGSVLMLTCLGLHGEVRLPLQDAVHQPGAVSVGGVIGICSGHLHHRRTFGTDVTDRSGDVSQTLDLENFFLKPTYDFL